MDVYIKDKSYTSISKKVGFDPCKQSNAALEEFLVSKKKNNRRKNDSLAGDLF